MHRPQRQQGATLIVSMIMLMLLTMVGVAGMRETLLQERMSGNARDRDVALQAAEAALRAGELDLQTATLPAFEGYGYYEMLDRERDGATVGEIVFWRKWDWSDDSSVAYNGTLQGVDRMPRYVVERLSAGLSSSPETEATSSGSSTVVQAVDLASGDFSETEKQDFRVTAIGWGLSGESAVIVQSTYRRE